MLSGCPSATFVCSFIWTHLVSTISHERLEHCWWNLQWIFIIHYWLDWRSKVKGHGRSRSSRWWRHPRRRWGIKVRLLIFILCAEPWWESYCCNADCERFLRLCDLNRTTVSKHTFVTSFVQNEFVPWLPRMGPGYPLPPLLLPCPFISLSFALYYFFPFSFSHSLYLFSSIVHPIPFYQNRPTPFPGERL